MTVRLALPPRRVRWALAVAVVAAALVAAAVPGGGPAGTVLGVRVDWGLHALAGGGTASALAYALDGPRRPAAALGGAFAGALAVGAAGELLQVAVAGRQAGAGDLLAYAAGALVAVTAWRAGHRWIQFE
jgi:VanZ family protein